MRKPILRCNEDVSKQLKDQTAYSRAFPHISFSDKIPRLLIKEGGSGMKSETNSLCK